MVLEKRPGVLEISVDGGGDSVLSVHLLDDDRICQHIRAGKSFEPKTLRLWASWCTVGWTVIDVGAYSGLFSIIAARCGALAYAIEPMGFMAKRLLANAKLNGVKVNLLEVALSDEDGEARMGVNESVHLTSGASLKRVTPPHVMVQTTTLDTMMDRLLERRRVDAIKIDVERGEYEVLNGGRRLLARDRPKIIAEVLEEDYDPGRRERVFGLMAELDYRVADVLDVRNVVFLPV